MSIKQKLPYKQLVNYPVNRSVKTDFKYSKPEARKVSHITEEILFMKKTVFKLFTVLVLIATLCLSAAGCFCSQQQTTEPKDPATAESISFRFNSTDPLSLSFPVNVKYPVGCFIYEFSEGVVQLIPSKDLEEIIITFYKEAENADQTAKPSENPTEKPEENPSENPTDKPEENPSEKPEENPSENPSDKPEDKPEEKPAEINGEVFETVVITFDDDGKSTVVYKDGNGNKIEEDDKKLKYKCTLNIKNDGYIDLLSEEMYKGDKMKVEGSTKAGMKVPNNGHNEIPVFVVSQPMDLLDFLFIGVGIYLLYLAIRGKGKIYETEFVKEGMEKKHKLTIRLTCLIAALLTMTAGFIPAFDRYGKYNLVSQILFFSAIGIFIISIIITGTMIDKKARKEAQKNEMEGRSTGTSDAAFVFDDDEPTVDDIRNAGSSEDPDKKD